MPSSFAADLMDDDRRPYPAGRHRLPTDEYPTVKPALPAWAGPVNWPDNSTDLGLVGEGPTKVLTYRPVSSDRLPQRAEGRALDAEITRPLAPALALLGRRLHALRFWGRS